MSIRFQQTVRPGDRAAKAGCYLCLKNSGGMLDLDITIEGEGRLFICKEHGYEIAKTLKCLSPKKSTELTKRVTEQDFIIKGLQEALRDKESLISEQSSYIEKTLHKSETE